MAGSSDSEKAVGVRTAGRGEKSYTVIRNVTSDPLQSLLFTLPDRPSLVEEPPFAAVHPNDDKNRWGMSIALTLPVLGRPCRVLLDMGGGQSSYLSETWAKAHGKMPNVRRQWLGKRLGQNAINVLLMHVCLVGRMNQVGDHVLVRNNQSQKAEPNWTGPWIVLDVRDKGTIQLKDLRGRTRLDLVHINQTRPATLRADVNKTAWYLPKSLRKAWAREIGRAHV